MSVVNAVSPFEGTLEWVGRPSEGVSQSTGNPWKSVDFTLKWIDHQMQERFITFSASGVDRVNKLLQLPHGTRLKVSWMPSSRRSEYNGETKWWPSFQVLAINPVVVSDVREAQPAQQQQQFHQPTQQPQYQHPVAPAPAPTVQAAPPADDLPFD